MTPGVYLIDSTWGEALTKLVREPPHQTLWGADSVVEGFNVEHQGSEQTWALDDEGQMALRLAGGRPHRRGSLGERSRSPDRPPLPLRGRGSAGEPRTLRARRTCRRGHLPLQVRITGRVGVSAPRRPTARRQYAQIQDAESVILVASDWGAGLANLILDPPPIAPPAEDDEDAAEGEDAAADTDANGEAEDADSDDSA